MKKLIALFVLVFVLLSSVAFAQDAMRMFRKTSDPDTRDDQSRGYKIGDFWRNHTDGKIFICYDVTIKAAVWRQLALGDSGTTNQTLTIGAGTITSPTITSPTITSPTITNGTISGTLALSSVTLDNVGMLQIEPQTATYVSGQGYVLSGASVATIYEIPIDSAAAKAATDKCAIGIGLTGVTVEVMTPTAANHGQIIGLRNTSGTTAFYIWAGGKPVKTTSGTTHVGGEDVGDITWIQLAYNSGISVYILSEFKND